MKEAKIKVLALLPMELPKEIELDPGFIAGTDGEGNLASLPPQEMNYYAKKFRAFLIAL